MQKQKIDQERSTDGGSEMDFHLKYCDAVVLVEISDEVKASIPA
jgi:hypothetical protein